MAKKKRTRSRRKKQLVVEAPLKITDEEETAEDLIKKLEGMGFAISESPSGLEIAQQVENPPVVANRTYQVVADAITIPYDDEASVHADVFLSGTVTDADLEELGMCKKSLLASGAIQLIGGGE